MSNQLIFSFPSYISPADFILPSAVLRSDLWVHDSLLFEASKEHVHGEHLAPKVTVVLSIVTACQVSEGRWHVSPCRERQRGQRSERWEDENLVAGRKKSEGLFLLDLTVLQFLYRVSLTVKTTRKLFSFQILFHCKIYSPEKKNQLFNEQDY